MDPDPKPSQHQNVPKKSKKKSKKSRRKSKKSKQNKQQRLDAINQERPQQVTEPETTHSKAEEKISSTDQQTSTGKEQFHQEADPKTTHSEAEEKTISTNEEPSIDKFVKSKKSRKKSKKSKRNQQKNISEKPLQQEAESETTHSKGNEKTSSTYEELSIDKKELQQEAESETTQSEAEGKKRSDTISEERFQQKSHPEITHAKADDKTNVTNEQPSIGKEPPQQETEPETTYSKGEGKKRKSKKSKQNKQERLDAISEERLQQEAKPETTDSKAEEKTSSTNEGLLIGKKQPQHEIEAGTTHSETEEKTSATNEEPSIGKIEPQQEVEPGTTYSEVEEKRISTNEEPSIDNFVKPTKSKGKSQKSKQDKQKNIRLYPISEEPLQQEAQSETTHLEAEENSCKFVWEPQPSCSKDPDPPFIRRPQPQPGTSKEDSSKSPQKNVYITASEPLVAFLKITPEAEEPEVSQRDFPLSYATWQPVVQEKIGTPLSDDFTLSMLKIMSDKDTRESLFRHPEGNTDNTDYYIYRDCEDLLTELAEYYSYTEDCHFNLNMMAFKEMLSEFNLPPSWNLLSEGQRENMIMRLLDQLEVKNQQTRIKAAKCILYIAQGAWADSVSEGEARDNIITHGILLYRMGIFPIFVDLLKIEAENFHKSEEKSGKISETLMIVLNVLYTIVEVLRYENDFLESPYRELVESFSSELLFPHHEELVIITLFNMVVRFSDCRIEEEHFPIKKVLLLLWKLILVALGGLKDLEERKKKERMKNGLEPDHDASDQPPVNSPRKWKGRPKTHPSEIKEFLQSLREKYIGYTLPNDETTLAGLPEPVISSFKVMKQYLYMPLGEIQKERERFVESHPLTHPDDIELTPVEILYQAMYPNLKNYLLSLIKIMALIATKERKQFTCKPVIPGVPEKSRTKDNVILIDSRRYQEIILKAISSMLLLLLKHLKLNHVYQFEYVCRLLHNNRILMILVGFFRRDLSDYVTTVNEIPVLDFPACVIGHHTEITEESLNVKKMNSFSSRNLSLCINLLRILNKVVKWKPLRIEVLLKLSAYSVLKECVHVNNYVMKLYAFKVLKLQMAHLNKRWRRRNLKVLTNIFHIVRFHINDKYLRVIPVQTLREGQGAERQLQEEVNRFNNRRYGEPNQISLHNCRFVMSGGDPRTTWFLEHCLRMALYRWLKRQYLS